MAIQASIIKELQSICGPRGVLSDPAERLVYERDAFPLARSLPGAVVFPTSTAMASQVLKCLSRARIGFVPRGAGTSLAGGCLTPPDSVCVSTARMRDIIAIDLANECAVVEAGVVTQHISDAVGGQGYRYAPDPSSQSTCTIGGNVANNAGGPHTLAHGVTANHVLGLTAVLPTGDILRIGGRTRLRHGPDLVRLFCGTEGTFGLITEVTVRLTRRPAAMRTVLAVFDKMDDASNAVTAIIASGIMPAALEMMDDACLRIVDQAYGYGFPEADAVLIIELEGVAAGMDDRLARIVEYCTANHVRQIKHADDDDNRALLWKARKTAFGALGRAAPSCITQDGVVPRSRLPEILRFVREVADRHGLRVASNFHAGDGNIHPNFLFDGRDPQQVAAVEAAGHEILAECVRLGGSISGEHGIGIEKVAALRLMYSASDLAAQQALRAVFDPSRRANADKIFGHGEERRA